jgi:stage V sporulation protein B
MKIKMKRESFLKGAMILTLAGVASRILGAVYRIPLARLVGSEGVGLAGLVYPLYIILLTVSTLGIPIAISKLIAERVAIGDSRGVQRVFVIALAVLSVSGLVFSAALYFGARTFAGSLYHEPRSYLSIMAIAPAIVLVAVMSALRGYFQGLQMMTPTGVSQVVEQLVRVTTTLALAYILLPRGIEYAAAGIAFGAVTGGLAGLVYLGWLYLRHAPALATAALADGARMAGDERRVGARGATVIWDILRLSVPVSFAGLVLPLMQFFDSAIVVPRLQAAGETASRATALFGQLSQMAFPIINLPTMLTYALGIALVPAISSAVASGRQGAAGRLAGISLRVTMTLILPAMAGIYLLASPLCAMLYGEREAGIPLAALSAGLLFLALQQTSSGVLQGIGRTDIPVRSLLAGAFVKVALTWYLTGLPAFGVVGAAYGTVAGFLVAVSLNLSALWALVGVPVGLRDLLLKPVLATAVMAVLVRAGFLWVLAGTGREWAATLAAVGLGAAGYGAALVAFGGVYASDLEMVPRVGSRLAAALRRMGLVRDDD